MKEKIPYLMSSIYLLFMFYIKKTINKQQWTRFVGKCQKALNDEFCLTSLL